MKTIDDISQEIKAAFVANVTLQDAYDLDPGLTFDQQMPASSIEANIINVVATSIATMEWQQESYKEDVQALILASMAGTVPWYHALVLSFEYADEKIIKYAAVVEEHPNLVIKVNGADFAVFATESDQLIALRAFLNLNKFAGTHISVVSYQADDVNPELTIYLDASKFNSSGESLTTGLKEAEIAIDNYLASIVYNGTMNKTRLVDAIQKVDGVTDLVLGSVEITRDDTSVITMSSNNYRSYGGAFVSTVKTITYVLG